MPEFAQFKVKKRVEVLDYGFIEFIGEDFGEQFIEKEIGNADDLVSWVAKVSTDTQEKSNPRLVKYLYKNQHTSCFEFVKIFMRIKFPLFISHQWVRHRFANYSHQSGRYTMHAGDIYPPEKNRIKLQGLKKHDVIDCDDELAEEIQNSMKEMIEITKRFYALLVDYRVSHELARMYLPMASYSTCLVCMDLNALLNFLALRLHRTAQHEIRAYAIPIYQYLKGDNMCPITMSGFDEYHKINEVDFI